MARKPTISPSKLSTYLACPVKYRWTHVDGRGRCYLKAKSYYSFGTTLHRVLEQFHSSARTGVETVHEVLAAYEESWLSAGFTNAEEMAEAYGDGKMILERYVEDVRVQPPTAKTMFVEKQLRLDMGNFDLVGRIDRLDEHDDGTLEIVDYKSGRRVVTPEDVATDLALCCYQLMVRAAHPGRNVVGTIHALGSGDKATHSMSDEELAEFEADVQFLGSQMLAHDYEYLTPTFKPICPSCDFLALCRKHEDYIEPAADLQLT